MKNRILLKGFVLGCASLILLGSGKATETTSETPRYQAIALEGNEVLVYDMISGKYTKVNADKLEAKGSLWALIVN